MSKRTFPGHSSLTKIQKISISGVATLGAAALAFSFVPGNSESTTTTEAAAASEAAPVAWHINSNHIQDSLAKQQTSTIEQAKNAKAAELKKVADAKAKAAAQAKAKAEADAKAKAVKDREAKAAASRAAARKPAYANNLDGWIRQSLDIMKDKGIPGSYEGLHRNIMRESSGNPLAINNWDINAQNGIPSKGLLQVIKPTFDSYHVAGTPKDQYNPVANITAAANYAADRYGSIDNVDSAY
ncbi:Transglycosylase SLT domain protein [Streptomyces sp. YIM 130001]|uniref:transglycosylase SLT domain-containing protein n=1 Tax=Streptomyces sp. YIM 130001 TaxID=2259644 RepID=UPI000E652A7A|nr:transglycosylase SLT domain-containing protein [Streptomyces sp. YIM 130001]RII18594.1 Transglycosylase SLT domain protein [Streptomyces sp. YIM 130001]